MKPPFCRRSILAHFGPLVVLLAIPSCAAAQGRDGRVGETSMASAPISLDVPDTLKLGWGSQVVALTGAGSSAVLSRNGVCMMLQIPTSTFLVTVSPSSDLGGSSLHLKSASQPDTKLEPGVPTMAFRPPRRSMLACMGGRADLEFQLPANAAPRSGADARSGTIQLLVEPW